MLILERKPGEAINLDVGDGVEIRVKQVKGGQVALAIEAPSDIKILREELAGRSTPAKRKARQSIPGNGNDGPAQSDHPVLRLSTSRSE